MLSVKVSIPQHLRRGLLGIVKLYGFVCPSCKIYLSQLSSEITPNRCKICFAELPDVRGLVDRAVCRIGYHIEKGHE